MKVETSETLTFISLKEAYRYLSKLENVSINTIESSANIYFKLNGRPQV